MPSSAPRVRVVLSERGGMAERMARALDARLDGVTLGDTPDTGADITYYIGAEARTAPAATLEMAWFARGASPGVPQALWQIARGIDQPVAADPQTRDLLGLGGVSHAAVIPPGIDRDRFDLRLRIGLYGQTKQDGMPDIDGSRIDWSRIDWRPIAAGGSGAGDAAADADRAEACRALDCLVITTPDSGADLAAIEALAVGTPVVAPRGSGLGDLPHLTFRGGDMQDLARVLRGLGAQKDLLRAATAGRTWDAFAAAHDRLFRDLVARGQTMPARRQSDRSPRTLSGSLPGTLPGTEPETPAFSTPVRLLLHGGEHTSLGGPSIRVPRTADALRDRGVPARSAVFGHSADIAEDVVHLFNVWPPASALKALRALKAAGKTVVFSPIYLDLKEHAFWQGDLPHRPLGDSAALRADHAAARAALKGRGRQYEIVPGYHAMIRDMLRLADHVIFLSAAERAALAEIGAEVEDARASLVVNPVDPDDWSGGDPDLFRRTWLGDGGPQDYVVCVARIEERKNQLMLAHALRTMPPPPHRPLHRPLRLVLVGHPGSPDYVARVRAAGGPEMVMTGRLEPGGEMLRAAFAGAAAFALPSWAEGAALAALEAAAGGVPMVLGDRGAEREYFGDLAQYCDPGDPDSIRAALDAALALDEAARRDRAGALDALLRDRHSWAQHAQGTAAAYARACAADPRDTVLTETRMRAAPRLVLDITGLQTADPGGMRDGGGRIDAALVQALQEADPDLVRIFRQDGADRFITVPARLTRLDQALRHCRRAGAAAGDPVTLSPQDTVLVLGLGAGDLGADDLRSDDLGAGARRHQATQHLDALADLKMQAGCGLLAAVHDLGPVDTPLRYPAELSETFQNRFQRLDALADGFVTSSRRCATDLAHHSEERRSRRGADDGAIALIRPCPPPAPTSDKTRAVAPGDALRTDFSGRRFVLSVGEIASYSNHEMLCRVWARLADTGRQGDLHLVIAGPLGPGGQDLAARIARDPRLAPRLHILTAPTPADLDWLYAQCLFTALPDPGTGAGLALCESLARGKLCLLASADGAPDILPDAAPNLVEPHLVEPVDPEDFSAWLARIALFAGSDAARLARQKPARGDSPQTPPRPPVQMAAELTGFAARPRPIRSARRLHVGEIAWAGNRASNRTDPLAIRFGAGWHPADADGRRMAQATARIWLGAADCLRPGLERLTVLLRLRPAPPDTVPGRFRVCCGDTVLFAAGPGAAALPDTLALSVPVTAADEDGMLALDLHLPPVPDSAVPDSAVPDSVAAGPATAGPVGAGLIWAALLDPDLSNPLHSLPDPGNWSEGDQPLHMDMTLDAHRQVIGPDLAFAPGWGVGAALGAVCLYVPLLPGARAQRLELTLRPVATPAMPVTATIRWNGRILAVPQLDSDLPCTLDLALTQDDLAHAAPGVLSIETDSALTPAALGLGVDDSLVGLGVTDLFLTPAEEA